MSTRLRIVILTVFLCLVLAVPAFAQVGDDITILNESVEASFPLSLTFSLSAKSDTNITDIRLRYAVEQVSFAQVVSEAYIPLVPNTVMQVEWTLDMRRIGGLPTGSTVKYWWIVSAGGNRVETNPKEVSFNDIRFPWRDLTDGNLILHWYQGDENFSRDLMVAAEEALARLAKDTGANLERPVNIYIYNGSNDLQGSMIFPQEWTGGVTYARYSTIAIGIAPDNLEWGKRAMSHELSHMVISQITLNPYSDLPTWLSEGLAVYAEGDEQSSNLAVIRKALDEGNLISVRSLSSPFSAYGDQAILSYAQSYSFVEFLISKYGSDKMLQLLEVFGQSSDYDAALNEVYGFDMDGLNVLWLEYITVPVQQPVSKVIHPVLISLLSAMATGLILVSGLFIEKLAWKRGW